MDFQFSAEQVQLRNEVRRFLTDKSDMAAVRSILDGPESYHHGLWKGVADMGLLGINIPEAHGGLGLGYLELCVVAEELGRAVAPIPFAASVYLATEFLLAAGSDAQQARWLPRLAAGDAIGTFAFAETSGPVTPATIMAAVSGGTLNGTKLPVPDGAVADFAIVAAQAPEGISLVLVELDQPGVQRTPLDTIDPTRGHARLDFTGAAAEPLGTAGQGWKTIEAVRDIAAVLTAFEQVGGSDKAIEMGRDYAIDRMAFGRPIGSFQAIKHMLANMYVSATLARSNAYYAAWALSTGAGELPQAAATARVSATQAYQHCARENLQVHGGMGYTWQADCHLHLRRSNLLALTLGGLSEWEDRLIDHLRAQHAA